LTLGDIAQHDRQPVGDFTGARFESLVAIGLLEPDQKGAPFVVLAEQLITHIRMADRIQVKKAAVNLLKLAERGLLGEAAEAFQAARPLRFAPRRSARRIRTPFLPVPERDNRVCPRIVPTPARGAKIGAVRGSKRRSWSSLWIDVKAGADRAFVNRVVARDRIEHRKHRLDRGVALHGWNHEPLFESRQRSQPPDRLYLG